MRTLNDYFLTGSMTDIATAGNSCHLVCPDGGRLHAIYMGVHTLIDAATTFDILLDGTDEAWDATLADATADETVAALTLGGTTYLTDGQMITIQSNGEQSASCAVDVTIVIRR